jgi:transposase-like protein
MRRAEKIDGRRCPQCGAVENQVKNEKNRTGSQRCFCNACKKSYTLDPKTREIPDEVKQQAAKAYYEGLSARAVGRLFA